MTSMHYPELLVVPCIQLASKPQLVEATSNEDDWTGTKDAAARRRAQTRLNTRAYRRRKALEKQSESSNAQTTKPIKTEALVECWDVNQQSVSVVPAARVKRQYGAANPLFPKVEARLRGQFDIVFPLSSDHLIILQQYNTLRAIVVNRTLISGVLPSPLACDEESIHVLPYPRDPGRMPSNLLPTALQQTVPHGDWIDTFPCPVARDRLIRAAGTFDEDELWADSVGGLFEGFPDDDVERRGILAWSPPWDVSGWEVSEGALRKWRWLFEGLPGMLEATNRWRKKRGEEPFVYEED